MEVISLLIQMPPYKMPFRVRFPKAEPWLTYPIGEIPGPQPQPEPSLGLHRALLKSRECLRWSTIAALSSRSAERLGLRAARESKVLHL